MPIEEDVSRIRRMCCYGVLALVGAAWWLGSKTTVMWLTTTGLAAAISPRLARSLRHREALAVLKRILEVPLRASELMLEWYADGGGGVAAAAAGSQSGTGKGSMVNVDVDTCLHFIVRDFILSWYHALSANSQFSKEVYYVLEDVVVAVCSRLRKIKRYRVARKAVMLYHVYFKHYRHCLDIVRGGQSQCVDGALDAAWSLHFPKHVALSSEETELQYLRHVVNVLLEVLTPVDIRTCISAKKLMVDILAKNVLLPLIDLVSNPDWLNGKLVVLLDEKQVRNNAAPGPMKNISSQNDWNVLWNDPKVVHSAKDDNDGNVAENENESCSKEECETITSDGLADLTDVFLPAEEEVRCLNSEDVVSDDTTTVENKDDDDDEEEEQNVQPIGNGNQHRRSLPSSSSFEHLSSFLSNVREELEKPMEYITDNFSHYFRPMSNESTSSLRSKESSNSTPKQNTLELFSMEDNNVPGPSLLRRRSMSILEQSHSISQALEGVMAASTGPVMANKLQELRSQEPAQTELCLDDGCGLSLTSNHAISLSSNLSKSTSGIYNVRDNLSSKPAESMHLNLKCSRPSSSEDVQEALALESNDYLLEEAVELSPDNRCFMNLSIPSVEVAEEPGGLDHYILYCIQYDAWYLDRPLEFSEISDSVEHRMVLQRTHVKRRFREFITLAHRIDENPTLKPYVQSIKKPSRPKIPMMNKFDREMIKERRVMLQQYLQKLISIEKIVSSSDLREFLAYGSDASIAYVTKVSEGMVPRIDKFLAKKMSGMFDKFRLPKPGAGIEEMTRQQLTSKAPERKSFLGIPLGSSDDIQNIHVKFGFSDNEAEALKLDGNMRRSVSDMKNEWANRSQPNLEIASSNMFVDTPTPSSPDRMFLPEGDFSMSHIPEKDETDGGSFYGDNDTEQCMLCIDSDIPLASAVIDLGLDGIANKEILLKKTSCVYLLKLLGGNHLEKWLHSKVDEYTTTEKCLHYLRQARDAVWPGGVLPMDPDPTWTEEEKASTKTEALQKLMEFFPNAIQLLLGADVYDDAVQLFFSSIQHPKLLRHLCYTMLDLVVETIAPEVKLDSFHARLTNS